MFVGAVRVSEHVRISFPLWAYSMTKTSTQDLLSWSWAKYSSYCAIRANCSGTWLLTCAWKWLMGVASKKEQKKSMIDALITNLYQARKFLKLDTQPFYKWISEVCRSIKLFCNSWCLRFRVNLIASYLSFKHLNFYFHFLELIFVQAISLKSLLSLLQRHNSNDKAEWLQSSTVGLLNLFSIARNYYFISILCFKPSRRIYF